MWIRSGNNKPGPRRLPRTMEQVEIERIFLEFIRQHWRTNMPGQLERGVWVSWHEAISSDEYEANTPVRKAWFITDRQIEARPALSFKLFAENRVQTCQHGYARTSTRLRQRWELKFYYETHRAGFAWSYGRSQYGRWWQGGRLATILPPKVFLQINGKVKWWANLDGVELNNRLPHKPASLARTVTGFAKASGKILV